MAIINRAALLQRASGFVLAMSLLTGAATAADVTGKVVDETTGAALPGAIVKSADGRSSAVSGTDGTFTLRGLADGKVEITISYEGYPTRSVTLNTGAPAQTVSLQPAGATERVTVVGRRYSDPRGLQTERSAGNTIDSLYANEVGKLPDQNVAETVRRLPGVSVANDQGEGRYVVIRGAGPDLVNVAVNGNQVGAPEEGARQVKLDGIPSSFISQVQVIKTLTPDLDANAIAGTVDIITLSAFDRQGPIAYGSLAGGHFELNGLTPWELEGTLGGKTDDEFGFVLSGNFSVRPFQSENVQGSTTWVNVGGFQVPNDFRLRDYNLERRRGGGMANFDWRPMEGVKTYLRGFYSMYSDEETRDQFRIELPAGSVAPSGQTATSGTFASSVRGTRFVRFRQEHEKIRSATLGGSFEDTEQKLELEASFTSSEKLDPNRNEWEFRSGSSTLAPATYDLSQFLFNVTPNATAYAASSYPLRRVRYVSRVAEEDLAQFSADYSRFTSLLGGEAALKAGVKYTNRDKSFDQTSRFFNTAGAGLNLSTVAITSPYFLYDGRYEFGPRVSYDLAQAFFAANPASFSADARGSAIESLVPDYIVNEKILAGYGLLDLTLDDVRVIAGVRVENTDATYGAKLLDFTLATPTDPGINNNFDKEYTDFFPSVNVRYEVMPELVLRAAVTTAIGRPNYEDMVPTTLVDGTNVTIGNPALDPLTSVNYDAGIEYYLGTVGVVSVSVFQKDIDMPIYRQTTPIAASLATPVTFGGTTFTSGTVNVNQARNATEGMVRGVELNLQGKASFLPWPLDGFGVAANIAYIDSEATVPGRADKLPLFLQSDRVSTLQAFYENDGIEARIAYTMRSKYIDEVNATSAAGDIYVADFGQLDARIGYSVTSSLQVFAEGTNLNDEPWTRWVGNESQLVENERYGRAFRFGIEAKY